MNAIALAQREFDNRQPPPVSETPQEIARAEWLYNAAEELLRGCNVSFVRCFHGFQGVTADQFALAVDEHVNKRLADCEVETSALALATDRRRTRANGQDCGSRSAGPPDHPLGKLGEIAESLLSPLADDALMPRPRMTIYEPAHPHRPRHRRTESRRMPRQVRNTGVAQHHQVLHGRRNQP